MENKVLFITPFFSPNIGGVETHLDDLINYLNTQKVTVDVITYIPLLTKIKAKIFEKFGSNKIFRIPWPRFNLFFKLEKRMILQFVYLTSGIAIFSFFYLLFKRKEYNVISCHGLAAGFIGSFLKIFFRKKTILTIHTIYKFSERQSLAKLVKFFVKKIDAILVLSKNGKKDIVDANIMPENKVFTYKNWVNENVFRVIKKEEARQNVKWDTNKFYALFVGRLTKEKGIKDLLEAVPFIDKNINIIVIGYGPFENDVKKCAKKHNNLIFLGKKETQKLAYYLNAADILLWGAADEDYLGIASISALACGLPILIPKFSFYHEIKKPVSFSFKNFKAGELVETAPKNFAKKLNSIFLNGIDNFYRREDCIKFYKENYSRKINGKIIYDVYFKNR